jgi:hypothetical protein
VTTPSIASHVKDLVATSHLPIFTTRSEHHVVVATLTVTLLSALKWTHISITLAPSGEIISTFGQVASRRGICIRHHAVISDAKNS